MNKPQPQPGIISFPRDDDIPRFTRYSPFVRQAGDQIRNGWIIETRKLLDYLLVYTGSGKGTFTVGEKTFRVGKGDFTWVPPDTPVRMEGDRVDMRVVYIHFDIIFDQQRSNWNMIIPGGCTDLSPFSRLRHPSVSDPEIENLTGLITEWPGRKASDLLIQICLEYERAVDPDHILLSSLTLQLIRELIRIKKSGDQNKEKRWRALAGAEEFIHTNLNRDLDVAALAQRFKLSTSHFRKLFRERFGISPVGMHRKLRIAKGSELLVYSDLNVSEAAFALGYSTVHSFSKAFRDVTGVSPTEYKQGKG